MKPSIKKKSSLISTPKLVQSNYFRTFHDYKNLNDTDFAIIEQFLETLEIQNKDYDDKLTYLTYDCSQGSP